MSVMISGMDYSATIIESWKFHVPLLILRENPISGRIIFLRLIQYRNLDRGKVLPSLHSKTCWNLNPRLIKKVAKVLLDLSSAGMQLFITTHNLFLIREIEILKNKKNKVRYFGLGFDDLNNLRISQSGNVEDLDDLVLLDEDLEQGDRFLKKDN